MSDQEIRETLQQHGLNEPSADVGTLRDLRWSARDNDWYIENQDGEVYWYDGVLWKHCPMGALR